VLGATSQVARLAVIPALLASPRARLVAVASLSDPDGCRHLGARVHPTYEALLADDEVEAVYVPLPNALHAPWVLRAAEAGRHVLCEKPLAAAAAEAEAMADGCRRAGVVLLEAYMTPFHPRSAVFADVVAGGSLGLLRFASAAFTGVLDRPEDHRWRPEMGGGALLDVGIYCLAPLLAAAGHPPVVVAASAVVAPGGVDASLAGWLDFGDGFTAAIECSFEAPERQGLEVVGTEAAVSMERAFTPGPGDTGFTLRARDGSSRLVECGGGDPYRGMVDHMAAVVRGGSALRRPPAASVELLQLVERLRAAAGLPPART